MKRMLFLSLLVTIIFSYFTLVGGAMSAITKWGKKLYLIKFAVAVLVIFIFAGTGWAFTADQVAKLLADDGAAGFGYSVAVSGDTAVIGANLDDDMGGASGSAYVFVQDGAGAWTQQAKLLATDGAAGDRFGQSVAVSGDTAVIGAHMDDDLGDESGSAYVFVRDVSGIWTQQAKLLATDGAAGDVFGYPVAVFGDTAVVGAHEDDDLVEDSGSAYVFVRDGAGAWSQQAKLLANDGAAVDEFGVSVAVSGDTAVIGADRDNDLGGASGSAYVFLRDGAGTWSQQAKLLATDGAAGDTFGYSVSISGDTAVIGAPWDDDLGEFSGSAYVFARDMCGTWAQQAKLLAADGAARDYFGGSVAVYGDMAVIGAGGDDDFGHDSGSAYVFVRDGSNTWAQQAKLVASDGSAFHYFGDWVAVSGDIAVIGESGSAYVFSLTPDSPETWALTLGSLETDRAVASERTPEGGTIVVGDSSSFGAWVVKLDANGSVLWKKGYDGTARTVVASPGGGYLLAGRKQVNGDDRDAWVLKLDEDGVVEWQSRYGGLEADYAVALAITVDCRYMLGGVTRSSGAGETDIWLMKLDTNGDILWQKTYGGTAWDELSAMQRTRDGGYILSGTTYSFDIGNGDFWVLKVDADGGIEWENVYGLDSLGEENVDYVPHIRQTQDGGYILAGITTPILVDNKMTWVLKLAADGAITWQNQFSGMKEVSSVLETDDLGYVLSGGTTNGWLMKLDPSGAFQWSREYSGPGTTLDDTISVVRQTPDTGLLAVGSTESLAVGDRDLWLLKLDANGDFTGCEAVQPTAGGPGEVTVEAPFPSVATVLDGGAVANPVTVTVTETEALQGSGCTPAVADFIDLPRTGQTTPYHAGDDGHVQAGVPWPSSRFVDNGDGTVMDYLTGLTWLKDANCLGTVSWENALQAVADFNANPTTFPCIDYDSENHENDWRAPNINEIESLVNAQVEDNAAWLISQGFVNVTPDWYWSSSTPAATYRRWTINMEDGMPSNSFGPGSFFRMWPVRGGQKDYWNPDYPANVWKTGQAESYYPGDDGDVQMGVTWPSRRFQDNGDGTVTDSLTGLVWLKDSHCFEDTATFQIDNWEDGLDAVADFNANPGDFDCADYDVAKHQEGWRVSNKKALLSLMDWSRSYPPLPEGHPFLNVGSRTYWSSTTYASDPQDPRAWVAYPTAGGGGLSHMLKDHHQPTVWPVRGEIHGNAVRDADFDGDGDADGRDIAILVAAFGSHWLDENFDPRTDMVVDGAIDQADLQAFTPHLGRTDCPCL